MQLNTISFTRPDGINVLYKARMVNAFDTNENFLITESEGIESDKEIKLFYWLDKKRWTINELSFFALNNELCMRIFDESKVEITSYGVCSSQFSRVFGFNFGINFN